MTSPRIAVIVARLGPYHVARLRAVGARLGAENTIALEVAAENREYAWNRVDADGFRRVTLLDADYQDASALRRSRAVVRALEREQPDAVALNGWGFAEAHAAAVWCRSRHKIAILMSDSQERDLVRGPVKEAVKRRFVALCDSALVGGETHLQYVERLGMDPARIRTGYDVVDNEHFARGADKARADAAKERSARGLPERFFLSTARFLAKKNLPRLLEAYAYYRREARQPWELVLMGDGPMRASLERQRRRLGLEASIHFPGFKQYEELPVYYGLASAFILASSVEQWGLVVNEAMAAGLPVLVSSSCGCARDLVIPGETGFTFTASQAHQLASRMTALSSDDALRKKLGEGSAALITKWGPERFAEALLEAYELGARRRNLRRPGLLGAALAP